MQIQTRYRRIHKNRIVNEWQREKHGMHVVIHNRDAGDILQRKVCREDVGALLLIHGRNRHGKGSPGMKVRNGRKNAPTGLEGLHLIREIIDGKNEGASGDLEGMAR